MLGDLIKIVLALFVVFGLGIAVLRSEEGSVDGGQTSITNLFNRDKEDDSDPPEEAGPSGLVIEHRDGQLLVLPWEAGGPVLVDATGQEIRRCPVNARFPDCL